MNAGHCWAGGVETSAPLLLCTGLGGWRSVSARLVRRGQGWHFLLLWLRSGRGLAPCLGWAAHCPCCYFLSVLMLD